MLTTVTETKYFKYPTKIARKQFTITKKNYSSPSHALWRLDGFPKTKQKYVKNGFLYCLKHIFQTKRPNW